MPNLKIAIIVVGIILAILVALLAGDYLGGKLGRWRLVTIIGIIALVSVIAFTVYAAVVLTQV